MDKIYFAEKGEEILKNIGMKKVEFAEKMGIRKQNVKALFKTNNIATIRKAASVMNVPFEMLIGYAKEQNISELEEIDGLNKKKLPVFDVNPTNIPRGETAQDIKERQRIIKAFYSFWRKNNPQQKLYNFDLKGYLSLELVSVNEVAANASLHYLSTLAVIQLDGIVGCSYIIKETPVNQKDKNQRPFERMLIMAHNCVGIGLVKLTVGVKQSNKTKVQYCITALNVD